MGRDHHYELSLRWTGNTGDGTRTYTGYGRDHDVEASGVGVIAASSDPAFRGDETRWNPELLFLASIAECHMLWYLNLAQQAGIVVTEYTDAPTALMTQDPEGGGGQFSSVQLRPHVVITEGDAGTAGSLHGQVAQYCFIARSLNFSVDHDPTTERRDG